MTSRWPVLVFMSMSCACGGARVEAGLANAPRLGGATAEDSHDVVVKMPANAPSSHPIASTWRLPGSPLVEGPSLVEPWLEHFYVGWPCSHVERRAPPVNVEPIACVAP